ncbi:unnamed protein product, partial [Porites evermanni]
RSGKTTWKASARGGSRKFRKGWLGHLPTCQLYRAPFGPPLNPPLLPQKRRHGPCRVEHSGDHGNWAYKEVRHDSGATNVL